MIKNVNYKVFRQLQCIFFALKIACTLQGKKKKSKNHFACIMQIVHRVRQLESCEKAFTLI